MQAFDGGVSKLFEVVSRVCKQDLVIEIGNKILRYEKPNKVQISPTFFYEDGCNFCSRCCGNYGHIMTLSEYNKVISAKDTYSELLSYLEEDYIYVNGNKVVIYRDAPRINGLTIRTARSERPACFWSFVDKDKYLCRIHDVRSFTCRMPHMMFKYLSPSKTTIIGLYDFGRNWALGCSYKLRIGNLHTLQDNIFKLQYTKQITKDLGVDTYMDECINIIRNFTNNFKEFKVPQKPLCVTQKAGLIELRRSK